MVRMPPTMGVSIGLRTRSFFFFKRPGDPRNLPSSPPRPSPDLAQAREKIERAALSGEDRTRSSAIFQNNPPPGDDRPVFLHDLNAGPRIAPPEDLRRHFGA